MPEDDAIAFQSQGCVPEPGEAAADFEARWRSAEARVRALEPFTDSDADPRPLSPEAQSEASRIAATETFRLVFGITPPSFVSLRLDVLISAQKYVDAGHVDGLSVPDESDEAAVLAFCMKANPIDPPMVGPDGAITFSSHYSQNLVALNPSFRQIDDHKVEVTASIISRPNYVQVAQFGNRFVITNGYHRALALINAGHHRLPCLLRAVPSLEAVGLVPPAFFDASRIMASRPPLARDFRVADGIADELNLRARNHILRVGFSVNAFEAPR